jgi:hypothetical protein
MITETYMTIVENVRSQKEAVAARHDFDIARIVADARQRQESSDRRVIRQGEQAGAGQPATRLESDSEGIQTPQSESEGCSR